MEAMCGLPSPSSSPITASPSIPRRSCLRGRSPRSQSATTLSNPMYVRASAPPFSATGPIAFPAVRNRTGALPNARALDSRRFHHPILPSSAAEAQAIPTNLSIPADSTSSAAGTAPRTPSARPTPLVEAAERPRALAAVDTAAVIPAAMEAGGITKDSY